MQLPIYPESAVFRTASTEETEALGAMLAKDLKRGDFVALYGDLGVGKTAFVRGMASVLAPSARTHSPTYTIVNVYRGGVPLYHFDCYRVTSEDDLVSTGFFDYEDGVMAVEWCENIPYALPDRYIRAEIEREGDGRRITLSEVHAC